MHGVVSVRNTTWAAAGLLWVAAATAQTAPPGGLTAEVKDAKAGNAPSEAARRQAESPYRFILLNASKPKPARKEAPARAAAKPVAGNAQVLPEAAAAARAQLTQAAARPAASPAPAASAPAAGADTPSPAASPVADTPPGAAAATAVAETKLQGFTPTAPTTPAGPAAAQPAPASTQASGGQAAAPGEALAAAPAPVTPPVKTLDIEPPAPPPEDEPVVLVPLKRDPPVIPPAVQREARKGSVKVHFTVMPDGSVHDAKAVSTTEFAFNRPVLAAVSKWRFEPIRSEQQVEVQIDIDLDAGR